LVILIVKNGPYRKGWGTTGDYVDHDVGTCASFNQKRTPFSRRMSKKKKGEDAQKKEHPKGGGTFKAGRKICETRKREMPIAGADKSGIISVLGRESTTEGRKNGKRREGVQAQEPWGLYEKIG